MKMNVRPVGPRLTMTGYSRRLPAILMPKPGTPEGNRLDVLAILKTNTGPAIRQCINKGSYLKTATLYNSFHGSSGSEQGPPASIVPLGRIGH